MSSPSVKKAHRFIDWFWRNSMKNYGLFYSYKSTGDVLFIIFDTSLKATKSEQRGRITVLYHNEHIISYNIKDVKDIVKIHSEGKIFLPREELIEVINYILKNENLPTLEVMNSSGFYIGEVIDQNGEVVQISLGENKVTALAKKHLNINDKVVVALNNTILGNQVTFKETKANDVLINAHICAASELGLQGDDILLVDKDLENGKDFFSTEAK